MLFQQIIIFKKKIYPVIFLIGTFCKNINKKNYYFFLPFFLFALVLSNNPFSKSATHISDTEWFADKLPMPLHGIVTVSDERFILIIGGTKSIKSKDHSNKILIYDTLEKKFKKYFTLPFKGRLMNAKIIKKDDEKN